jgi:excisionase family DNA binding protein
MADFPTQICRLPRGTPGEIVEFVERAVEENTVLRENGAEEAARARQKLLEDFVEAYGMWLDGSVTTEEAAKIRGCSEETIRRMAGKGELKSRRSNDRGHHRFRRGDLLRLDGQMGDG